MPETAFPNVPIPGLPSEGEWCLTRVDKAVQGTGEFKALGSEHKCAKTDKNLTVMGKVTCNLRLSKGRERCTDNDFIADDSTLSAEGEIIRRGDRLALFGGEFVITAPDSKRLFAGRIELLFLIGSHPSEKCDEAAHVEGWLVGKRPRSTSAALSLRAMLAGKFTAPGPRATSTDFVGTLCGIIVRPK